MVLRCFGLKTDIEFVYFGPYGSRELRDRVKTIWKMTFLL